MKKWEKPELNKLGVQSTEKLNTFLRFFYLYLKKGCIIK